MSVKFTDHSAEVKAAMSGSIHRALTAIGLTAVEVTNDYMQTRYSAPIYQTGDLMRSVSSEVRPGEDVVDVGSNLDYAGWVHDGTSRMVGRPFLRDAITQNGDIWKEVAEEYIGKGMK